MGQKKVRVRDLAEKYGISAKEIVKELEAEGFDVKNAAGVVPEDIVELVIDHLDGFKAKADKKKAEEEEITIS